MFDFKIDPKTNDVIINEDLEITNEIYSKILVSLFTNLDMDIVLDKGVGSILFKFYQSRVTTENLNGIRNATKRALEQLGYDIEVNVIVINTTFELEVFINNVEDNNTSKLTFRL